VAERVTGRRWQWAIGLTLLLVAFAAITATQPSSWKPLISAQFPGGEWVDGGTLSDWMVGSSRTSLVLLDVRTPEEYAMSHLRGAQPVDPSNPNVEGLSIPADATVVVYCSIGYRSAAIVDELKDAGIDDVYNLEGGLFDWANRDRPVYRGDKRVREVHPFNRWWGLLLKRERRARTSGDDR
jgi:rhodanese-related sulfurtransferase